jgi:hypothetical protein
VRISRHLARQTRSLWRRGVTFGALAAGLAATEQANARPGTHPLVVSTWDARASSVVVGYRHGSFSGGNLDVVSYHANFSSTSGKLSSQFGLYYLALSEAGNATQRGAAGSATAVFNLPVTRRFDNGLPIAAIDFYVGSAPTAIVSGERNYLTLPLVLGFGVPVTPVKALSITPWFELSPSFNLDTVVHPFAFSAEDAAKYVDLKTGQINLSASAVEEVVSKSVTLETSAGVGARGGLDVNLHVSDYVDLAANASLSSIGTAFSGTRVLYLGAAFVWRWDDIVPAVLPAEKRLINESCEDVELRFRSCPNARKWRSPEELLKLGSPATLAPSSDSPSAPPDSSVSAPAPVPAPAPSSVAPPTPTSDAPPPLPPTGADNPPPPLPPAPAAFPASP